MKRLTTGEQSCVRMQRQIVEHLSCSWQDFNSHRLARFLSIAEPLIRIKKVKASHTRCRALGPELIPVYRQIARRWLWVIHSAVPLLSARLPSQPQSITATRPVQSYTAWWQRHIGVNNLPKVATQLLPRVQELNPRPVDRKSNTLPVAPSRHLFRITAGYSWGPRILNLWEISGASILDPGCSSCIPANIVMALTLTAWLL